MHSRVLATVCAVLLAALLQASPAPAQSVLRLAMPSDVETLDPARAGDLTALNTMAPLYHQLLTYDLIARPVRLVPYAAEAMPAISADRRTYTFKLRRGLMFAPHPAFGGKPRELVAEDFVYSWKRVADPALSSMSWSALEGLIEGLDERVGRARRDARPFDLAAPVAGLRAVDRYTFEVRLVRPDPSFIYNFAYPGLSAVPREVVEAEGAEFARRPVGSGPYRVTRFQPGTRLDVERNPSFTPVPWERFAHDAPADHPAARAMRGKSVPRLDRVEMIRIPEPSTAVLSLLRGEVDLLIYARAQLVFDGAELKPELRAAGVRAYRAPDQGMYLFLFNMRDPVIGGLAVPGTALRRAIAMAIDDATWLKTFDQGVGTVRQHVIGPDVAGYDPAYRNPNAYAPATANALLDRTGYAKGADGWRRRPDGAPLELRVIIGTTSESRRLAEFLKRSLDAIGVRVAFDAMPGGDRLKMLAKCQHQISTMSFGGGAPDGTSPMENFHSAKVGTINFSCYRNDDYDRIFDRLKLMAPGPERAPLFAELTAILDAHAPARILPAADDVTLVGPRVAGFAMNPYLPLPYHLLDVVAPVR